MKNKSKIFLNILMTFIMIINIFVLIPPTIAHAAISKIIIGDETGYIGNGGGGIGSGTNYWWFTWDWNDPTILRVTVGNSDNNSCMFPFREKDKWGYSCAKSSYSGKVTSGMDIGRTFGCSSSAGPGGYEICTATGWPAYQKKTVSFDALAAAINKANNCSVTGAQVKAALDKYMNRCTNPSGDVLRNPDGNPLVSVNLSSIIEIGSPPKNGEFTKSEEVTETKSESKYIIQKIEGNTSGTEYNDNDGDNLAAYNNPIHYKTHSSSFNPYILNYSSAWNNTPANLSYTKTIGYGVDNNNSSSATYILVERQRTRTRTRTAHYITHYHGSPTCTNCPGFEGTKLSHYTYGDWGPWSSWKYKSLGTVTINKNGEVVNDTYIPDYKLYDWMDLTSEEFTHATTLTTGAGVKPIDYKDADEYHNSSLDLVLNSGKNAGEAFRILSDNNPKSVELKLNGILGIPINGFSTTRGTTKGSTFLVGSKISYGPVNNKQLTNQLISIQRTKPTNGGEITTNQSYSYSSSPTNLNFKFRSIMFGNYTIGDAKGSDYWYNTIQLARVNKLGATFTASAPGTLTSIPTSANLTLNKKALNQDLGLTASFIQPVLVGEIDVKDAAGI